MELGRDVVGWRTKADEGGQEAGISSIAVVCEVLASVQFS